MYKELIYETKEFVILKIYEHIHAKSESEIITSYPYQKDSLKVVFDTPDKGVAEIEYITKIDKLQSIPISDPLKTIEFNCMVTDKILSDTILNESGEITDTAKFKDIKSFAMYIKALNDLNLDYIRKN